MSEIHPTILVARNHTMSTVAESVAYVEKMWCRNVHAPIGGYASNLKLGAVAA